MQYIIRGIVVAFAATTWSINPAAAGLPTGSDPLTECHKVASEVGLLIRTGASSESKKIGSLQKGQKVNLDGEELAGTGAVYPMMKTSSDGGFWVKIKTPKAGYVLYATKDDPEYRYLVPCKG